jgi:hypothetical protein
LEPRITFGQVPRQDSQQRVLEVLVVIGYSDENHLNRPGDLIGHKFFYDRAQYTESRITEQLFLENFTQDPKNPARFFNPHQKKAFTVLNVNELCPGENPKLQMRSLICARQIQKSEEFKTYLEHNLTRFDEFIYIGHSRLGLGLGLGPFFGNAYTFDLAFYNSVEAGRLRKIVIASCDSENYYERKVTANTQISFVGTQGLQRWPEDVLPLALREISTYVRP